MQCHLQIHFQKATDIADAGKFLGLYIDDLSITTQEREEQI